MSILSYAKLYSSLISLFLYFSLFLSLLFFLNVSFLPFILHSFPSVLLFSHSPCFAFTHAPGQNCTGVDEFLCPNGRCIRRANVCDSQCDCVPSPGSNPLHQPCTDETDCESYYTNINGENKEHPVQHRTVFGFQTFSVTGVPS